MPPATDDDRILLRQVVENRSETAFRRLYRRHTPVLRRLLEGMLDGLPEVDDAAQDTWIIAVERLGGFRGDSSFRTWLLGIGFNVARSTRRTRSRRSTAPIDAARDIAAAAAAPGELLDLERALALLPEGYRRVLVLHDLEERTHEEIAGRLGIAAGTSKSQLHQARRALRALLDPAEVDHDS